jgi:hypothetical protein
MKYTGTSWNNKCQTLMVLYADTELAMNSTEIPTLAPWFAIQTEQTWYEDSSKFPHRSSSGYWCKVNLLRYDNGVTWLCDMSTMWWTQPCSHCESCYWAGNVTATLSVCATEE